MGPQQPEFIYYNINPSQGHQATCTNNQSARTEFIPFETPEQVPNEMILAPRPSAQEQNYCDITEYLNMPQTKAAKLLGIPTSTLSKRWKEAAPTRKWPWRTTCKIDKKNRQYSARHSTW